MRLLLVEDERLQRERLAGHLENVRQLRNVIERSVLLSRRAVIDLGDLPAPSDWRTT